MATGEALPVEAILPAKLSHEIRGALTGMQGWTWLLRRHTHAPEEVARVVEKLEHAIRSLGGLADRLGIIARALRGDLQIDARPVAVESLLEEVLDRLHDAATGRRITIETSCSTACVVAGDAARLGAVVEQLLHNAIRFTPPGGRVRVELREEGGEVTLVVRDTGPGVREEIAAHLFEPFRVEADGLGLGLATAGHIVAAHGGTLRFEAGDGRWGSTFVVRLPGPPEARVTSGPPPVATDGVPPMAGMLEDVRVLAVDDDRDTLDVVAEVLRTAGAVVRTADSAPGALAELARWTPDLLLSDLAMPGEDGIALAREVRGRHVRPGSPLPIVALSAHASEADRQRALGVGFDAHLAKPFDPVDLVELLDDVLRRRARERLVPGVLADRTVLLVDDDVSTRETAEAVLLDRGCRVRSAASGEQALEIWEQHGGSIDVVVTDLMMGFASGVTVYRAIHSTRPEVPVVIMSAYPLAAELLSARTDGVVAYLEKPFEPTRITECLTEVFAGARAPGGDAAAPSGRP